MQCPLDCRERSKTLHKGAFSCGQNDIAGGCDEPENRIDLVPTQKLILNIRPQTGTDAARMFGTSDACCPKVFEAKMWPTPSSSCFLVISTDWRDLKRSRTNPVPAIEKIVAGMRSIQRAMQRRKNFEQTPRA